MMSVRRPLAALGGLRGRRILVVEDEYFIADDLSRTLQKYGALVVGPVPDLSAGLDLATREQLDGAVLDVNLGGQMSYGIADKLGERGVPFLFTTGYDVRALAPAYARIRRLEKPFEATAVLAALVKIVCKQEAEP